MENQKDFWEDQMDRWEKRMANRKFDETWSTWVVPSMVGGTGLAAVWMLREELKIALQIIITTL